MKKIVVLGGGISGYGSAVLAKKRGFDVFLSDAGRLDERYKSRLDEWNVPYEEGGHTVERILDADEVIKSPGIPDSVPLVVQLRERGVPIVSEIEFAGRYMGGAKTICITGSNGKTTTTSLIYKILRDAGYNVALGGNIGESFAYSVATGTFDWYVLELSSFQLDGMFDFRAHIAVLMNVTPDHLDRYDYDFAKYVASKMRIAQNQTPEDFFVYWQEDKNIATGGIKSHLLPFSAEHKIFDMQRLQIQGMHNLFNAEAAYLATTAAGVARDKVLASIYDFRGVEHRLEPAGELDGVAYINDSKATNVDSAWYALEAQTRPVVWIAGGTDKGNDYTPLLELAHEKVHTLICMGVDNEKLITAFSPVVPEVVPTSSLEEAMRAARAAARRGDVVLLSPACASFDLFKNYEDRGRQFKEWIVKQK